MIIRPATHADVLSLIEMGAAFHAASGLAEIATFEREDFAATLRNMIDAEPAILLVAEGDDIIGMAGALVFPFYFNALHKTAQEVFWYVDPAARGNVGVALLDGLEQAAREKGCESMIMIELDRLRPVSALYERRGYSRAEHSWIRRL